MTPITLELPDELADQVQTLSNQLPEILRLGLREFYAASQPGFKGAAELLEFLAGLPEPDEIMTLRPSDELQTRITELLEKNRLGGLSASEEEEWQQYEFLEHLVRIAKATALKKLASK